ncbi:MAG: hypothetical protein GY949_01195 [Gammaproteobacteria bacterium]|nr:hypothetical protein [Gammaproteobacteria bacterium]
MNLDYTISYEHPLINVRTEGLFDYLKAYEMWEAIVASCEDNNCTRVLGISNLQEPISSMDAYDHLSIFQSVGVTDKHRIAWVAGKPNLLEKLRLAETVLKNRGSIDIQIFESVTDAKRWLESSD